MNARGQGKKRQLLRLKSFIDGGGSVVVEEGLWRRRGSPAEVRGIFRRRLVVDPMLGQMTRNVREFVLWHESQHIAGGHLWWYVACAVLCPVGLPFVKMAAERDADRAAAEVMKPADFANAVKWLHPQPQKKGIAGWLDRLYYGATWEERCERAGLSVRHRATASTRRPSVAAGTPQAVSGAAGRDRAGRLDARGDAGTARGGRRDP